MRCFHHFLTFVHLNSVNISPVSVCAMGTPGVGTEPTFLNFSTSRRYHLPVAGRASEPLSIITSPFLHGLANLASQVVGEGSSHRLIISRIARGSFFPGSF